MSVVLCKCSHWDGRPHPEDKCSFCDSVLRYPFIWWRSENKAKDIFICMKCCHRIKSGLLQDMIHLNAIYEIRAIGGVVHPYYKDVSLKITMESSLQDEHDKADKEMHDFMLKGKRT